nr:hypothetical protein B0A51_15608 [Rachicladosporium sp. CCFEE 5018]
MGLGAVWWFTTDAHLFLTTHQETVPFTSRRRDAGEPLSDEEADRPPRESLDVYMTGDKPRFITMPNTMVCSQGLCTDRVYGVGTAQYILSKVAAVADLQLSLQVFSAPSECSLCSLTATS